MLNKSLKEKSPSNVDARTFDILKFFVHGPGAEPSPPDFDEDCVFAYDKLEATYRYYETSIATMCFDMTVKVYNENLKTKDAISAFVRERKVFDIFEDPEIVERHYETYESFLYGGNIKRRLLDDFETMMRRAIGEKTTVDAVKEYFLKNREEYEKGI